MSIEHGEFKIEEVCEISLEGADKSIIDEQAAGRRLLTKINLHAILLTHEYKRYPELLTIKCNARHRECLRPAIMNSDMWSRFNLEFNHENSNADDICVTLSWIDPALASNAVTTKFKFITPGQK